MVEDEKVMMEEKKDEGTMAETNPADASEDMVEVVDAGSSDNSSTSENNLGDVPDATPNDSSEGVISDIEAGEGDKTFGSVDILADSDEAEAETEMFKVFKEQIAGLQSELEERSGQYKRIAADFENFRRRTQREKEEADIQIRSSTITELLPVIDNFERARSQIKPQTEAEMNIHKSYQGVYKQLVDCLKRLGVSPMRSEGQVFDPNLHEAVMREPSSEYDEGVVIEDLRRGYILGDRVLRHAMVKVAVAAEPSSESEESSSQSSDSNTGLD